MADRTVIVTGAARGQGEAEARRLVAAGATVLIADILTEPGQALADELGERARFVELDVTRAEDWQRALAAVAGWPPVTGLVNNAGIHWAASVETENAAAMARMLEVNVTGALLGMQAVAPAMRAVGGGAIVNVCSVLALVGGRHSAAYSASKWALRGLTKSAALDLGPGGMRVNAIHPGYIDTPMLAGVAADRGPEYYHYLPLRRAGGVDEIAELVLFLISPASGYLTGCDLAADGGMLAGAGPRLNFPSLGG
jgi:3alpha(or 20beta)-hydroxysteroid dehydrogenase